MHTRRGPLLETYASILLSIPYITKPGLHVWWCPGDWPERGPAGGVGVMVCRPRSSPPPTAQPAIPWPEPSPASGHPFHCHWNMQLDTPVTRYATEGVNKVSPLCLKKAPTSAFSFLNKLTLLTPLYATYQFILKFFNVSSQDPWPKLPRRQVDWILNNIYVFLTSLLDVI